LTTIARLVLTKQLFLKSFYVRFPKLANAQA